MSSKWLDFSDTNFPDWTKDTQKDSSFEYNSALFDTFHHDLQNNLLPEIPDPTQSEIMNYTQERNEKLSHIESESGLVNMKSLMENNAIPVEVEIWVDKVYSYYFNELKPLLGMVHWCQGAKKQLYMYRGYTWHTIDELYPDIIFD